MAINDLLPCVLEFRRIQFSANFTAKMAGAGVNVLRAAGFLKDGSLRRRKWIDIFKSP